MSGNQLYFSKIEMLQNADVVRGWTPYRSHQVLWDFFDNARDQRRDFLYRLELDRGKPCYYMVSMRRPREADFPWRVRVKDYDPQLRFGDVLKFSLRANPTVSQKGGRHDILMAGKRRLGPDWREKTTEAALMQKEGAAWLSRKAWDHGFQINESSVRVEGYRKHWFHKTSDRSKKKPPISVSTLDIQGILKVTDPDRFRETLYNGVGRGKAFGCGLLLVKR